MEELKKTTIDDIVKSIVEDTAQANKVTPAINEEVVAMLVSLYEQNEKTLKNQDKVIEVLTDFANREPIKVTTKEVAFPAVMEVEEVSPVKEVVVSNLSSLRLPDPKETKPFFDALSSENVKGQFAIIDAIDRLTEFLKGIDWEALKKKPTSDFGGTFTPSWHIDTPTGSINSSNRTFTLSATPKTNSLFLFLGGILQTENEDYTISRNVITYTNAPPTGVTPHVARYQ